MYQVRQLQIFSNLVHGFSTVDEGNMGFKIGNKVQVARNRGEFLRKLKVDINNCVAMWVVHGNEITVADQKLAGKSMEDWNFAVRVDGLITNQKNLFLFLLIADCLPIILYDPKREAVGLIHAGWKSTDLLVAKKAVEKMGEEYGCSPGSLIVGFGPAARKDSFIKENPSQLNDPEWEGFLERIEDDKYKIDFVGFCKKQLIDAGVREKNIFDCGINTVSDKRFFSHYRDSQKGQKDQGRFACVVGVK